MKKSIKKMVRFFLVLLAVFFVCLGSGTTVSYTVMPSYMVTIPTGKSVTFHQNSTSYGKIVVEEAIMDENKCIQVSVQSDKKLKNTEDANQVIPYEITDNNAPFLLGQYTRTGEETELFLSVTSEEWNRAVSGNYTGNVSFTVSYVDKNTQAGIYTGTVSPSGVISTIQTSVPEFHQVKIYAEHVTTIYENVDENDEEGITNIFAVPRFADAEFSFGVENGYKIVRATLNGENVTAQILNGSLMIPSVNEDKNLTIETALNSYDMESGSEMEHEQTLVEKTFKDAKTEETGIIGDTDVSSEEGASKEDKKVENDTNTKDKKEEDTKENQDKKDDKRISTLVWVFIAMTAIGGEIIIVDIILKVKKRKQEN